MAQPAQNLFWGKISGGRNFDFRLAIVFCFGCRLWKHIMTRYAKNLGSHGPPGYAYASSAAKGGVRSFRHFTLTWLKNLYKLSAKIFYSLCICGWYWARFKWFASCCLLTSLLCHRINWTVSQRNFQLRWTRWSLVFRAVDRSIWLFLPIWRQCNKQI